MGEKITLSAESRTEADGKAAKLRREGYVPAVVYGQGKENDLIKIKAGEMAKVYGRAGESALIELKIDQDKSVNVLIQGTDSDPVKGKLKHVDFFRVNMRETIETEIPLEFVGEAPAVKLLGGVLVKSLDAITVECLPGDLVGSIEADISSLNTFDDVLKVGDIAFPKGMKPLLDPHDAVATVQAPREEEQEVQTAAEVPAVQAGDEQSKEKSGKESGS